MALLVSMHAEGSIVSARIAISGLAFWHYMYAADGAEFTQSGTSAGESAFDLGTPGDLHLDVNSWHIVLFNPTEAAVKYEVSLAWRQNGEVIAAWPPKGPKKGTIKASAHVVLDDSAFLVAGLPTTADPS